MRTALASLSLFAGILAAPASGAHAADLAVTPPHGGLETTFIIDGRGFTPGQALDIAVQAPNGTVIPAATPGRVVVADGDGDFSLELTPSVDLTGKPAGAWLVQACVMGTDECAEAKLVVSPRD